jgi:pimeloyl-ACP methyl ester carboxylesterase
MPVVLVAGVPETPAIWSPLRDQLGGDDVVAIALPGFGVAVPEGFPATKEAYVDWLVRQVEALGEPVDLVGHDWGGILVARLADTRPDLVRTWVTDAPAVLPEWEWHQMAVVWQTPEVGEEFMAAWAAQTPAEVAAGFAAMGIPDDAALEMATAIDEPMRACILAFYRSAVDVGTEWALGKAAASRPALVVEASDDPFRPDGIMERLRERVGGEIARLDGCGHWWMLQRPAEAARALADFFARR